MRQTRFVGQQHLHRWTSLWSLKRKLKSLGQFVDLLFCGFEQTAAWFVFQDCRLHFSTELQVNRKEVHHRLFWSLISRNDVQHVLLLLPQWVKTLLMWDCRSDRRRHHSITDESADESLATGRIYRHFTGFTVWTRERYLQAATQTQLNVNRWETPRWALLLSAASCSRTHRHTPDAATGGWKWRRGFTETLKLQQLH